MPEENKKINWPAKIFLRCLVNSLSAAIWLAGLLGKRKRSPEDKRPSTILLTATYFSENWILNFLRPLAASDELSRVWFVGTLEIPEIPKVKTIYPPGWLKKILGEVPARLLTFVWTGLRRRPDMVGGFHLLINGMVASLLAKLIRGRAIYINGGGPREVFGGGYQASRLFSKLKAPDDVLEKKMIKVVNTFDLVVTMGSRTIQFFQDHGVKTRFEVIPGGIKPSADKQCGIEKKYDLIILASLKDPVKRIDVFLKTVQALSGDNPSISAAIVGTGRNEASLKALCEELGVQKNVTFAGFVEDVNEWLSKSRVFMLTSDSEGLSLALMEAMMNSLPSVVSDVGELSDIVKHGENGYLVKERTPANFAQYAQSLLQDEKQWKQFSEAARQTISQYEIPEITRKWGKSLGGLFANHE